MENKKDINGLINIVLSHQDSDFRIQSVTSLCNIGDIGFVDILIAKLEYSNNNIERICSAEAFSNIGSVLYEGAYDNLRKSLTKSVEPLIKALNDHSKEVRGISAVALGKIGDIRAVEPLIHTLEDSYFMARANSIFALGNIGDIRAVEPLIKTLNDSNEYVRLGAAHSLGFIGMVIHIIDDIPLKQSLEKSVEPLIRALDDEFIKSGAIYSLGFIGDTRAVEPLIHILEDPDETVRNSAFTALIMIADVSGAELLIKVLENHREDFQDRAATALSGMGDIAVEPLIKALYDHNKDVQCYAASILGNIGNVSAVEPLVKVLETPPIYYIDLHPGDPEWDVQVLAAMALGNIGDLSAVKPLQKALKSTNKNLSYIASEALDNIDQSQRSENLGKLNKSEHNMSNSASYNSEDLLDINMATESDFASLPYFSPVVAKKAINIRSSQGEFKSVEEFSTILNLKQSIANNIENLVFCSELTSNESASPKKRIIDSEKPTTPKNDKKTFKSKRIVDY